VSARRPGRLPYLAAALFISVLLWAVVRGDQVIERTMTLTLAPRLDDGLQLEGKAPQVRVRVSGRARELVKLASGAPLRADASDATPGALRLELRATNVELPDGVDATVRDVRPRTVTVRVARVAVPEPAKAR
jgi:hypothetical protein